MKTIRLPSQLALLSACMLFSLSSLACTTDLWIGGITGTPIADSPAASVSRVSGECAMKLSAAGSVKDTNPVAEPQVFIRFYVYAQLNAGTPVIFEAFSDDGATASLLNVTFDGTNFGFDAGSDLSGPVLGKSGWNLVEVAWTGGGTMDYWVNVDSSETATGTVTAAAGLMESVVLGTTDTLDGMLTFDDYVSHRETPIGQSDICNADGLNAVDLLDALEVIDEYFASPQAPDLAAGSPDCDLSGAVDLLDALDIIDIYFGP